MQQECDRGLAFVGVTLPGSSLSICYTCDTSPGFHRRCWLGFPVRPFGPAPTGFSSTFDIKRIRTSNFLPWVCPISTDCWRGSASVDSHVQRIQHKLRSEIVRHRPADELPGVGAQAEREVEPTLLRSITPRLVQTGDRRDSNPPTLASLVELEVPVGSALAGGTVTTDVSA
jgi:hypothetical protein